MSVRNETMTSVEQARQAELDRSWLAAKHSLADPDFRAGLVAAIERVNTSPSEQTVTRAEFLASTESTSD